MTAVLDVQARPADDGWECAVEVEDHGQRSRHTVLVRRQDLERWGGPGETAEQLVRRAFQFLLAREPASRILSRFDLPVIECYFPEFDQEIRRR